jgi:hypothetical protein
MDLNNPETTPYKPIPLGLVPDNILKYWKEFVDEKQCLEEIPRWRVAAFRKWGFLPSIPKPRTQKNAKRSRPYNHEYHKERYEKRKEYHREYLRKKKREADEVIAACESIQDSNLK